MTNNPSLLNSPENSTAHRLHSFRFWLVLITLLVISLLFFPVIYYSLTTPFALVDDYGMCYYVEFFDNSARFLNWLERKVVHFNYGRYRPFFDLYNMATWKIFGPSPLLHHGSRWLLHFASIFFFVIAYASVQKAGGNGNLSESDRNSQIFSFPLFVLITIWLFFPNVPAARLGPQEINTVFFLGLCNWMMVLLIIHSATHQTRSLIIVQYSLLYISFVGLSISKEVNIAVLLWVVLFYYLMLFKKFSIYRIIAGIPLLCIFLTTVTKIAIASKNSYYGTKPITLDLLTANAGWMYKNLFQLNTSTIITWTFIILISALLLTVLKRILKTEFDHRLLFIVFLLGEFAAFFLILSTSWAKVLRYWYPLIPIFSTLLAFSTYYIARTADQYHKILSYVCTTALACFLLYFVGCNYYAFLLQTIAQHSIRHAEYTVIDEIKTLHRDGHYVYILNKKDDPNRELALHLIDYFRRFEPRFYGEKYRIYTNPPRDPDRNYFIVTRQKQPEEMEVHRTIKAQEKYRILEIAAKIAYFLRGKPPVYIKDAGVDVLRSYQWTIYKAST